MVGPLRGSWAGDPAGVSRQDRHLVVRRAIRRGTVVSNNPGGWAGGQAGIRLVPLSVIAPVIRRGNER